METQETRAKLATAIRDLQAKGDTATIDRLVSAYKTKYVTTPENQVESAKTAWMPSTPNIGEQGPIETLKDTSKMGVNLVGRAVDMVKDMTYGAAKRVAYDIPTETYGLYKESGGVLPAISNLYKTVAQGTPFLPSMIKQDVPSQTNPVAESLKGFIPDAAKELVSMETPGKTFTENIQNRAERVRQAIINDPLSILLGAKILEKPKGFIDETSKGLATTKEFITSPIKSLKEVGSDLGGMYEAITAKSPEKVNAYIDTQFTKGVRPSVTGKGTAAKAEQYQTQARSAVNKIVENKQNLKITDEYGELTGKLPENLDQFSQAIQQTKQQIWKQVEQNNKAITGKGIELSTEPAYSELQKIANDKVIRTDHPEVASYAMQMGERMIIRDTQGNPVGFVKYTPEEMQAAITSINQELKGQKVYGQIKKASVDAMKVNIYNKILDSAMKSEMGSSNALLRKDYSNLSAIEKDVIHRAIVDARKNNKGLIDFSDMLSAREVIYGLTNPSGFLAAGAIKGVSLWQKYLNNPNVAIKKMFEAADTGGGQKINMAPRPNIKNPNIGLGIEKVDVLEQKNKGSLYPNNWTYRQVAEAAAKENRTMGEIKVRVKPIYANTESLLADPIGYDFYLFTRDGNRTFKSKIPREAYDLYLEKGGRPVMATVDGYKLGIDEIEKIHGKAPRENLKNPNIGLSIEDVSKKDRLPFLQRKTEQGGRPMERSAPTKGEPVILTVKEFENLMVNPENLPENYKVIGYTGKAGVTEAEKYFKTGDFRGSTGGRQVADQYYEKLVKESEPMIEMRLRDAQRSGDGLAKSNPEAWKETQRRILQERIDRTANVEEIRKPGILTNFVNNVFGVYKEARPSSPEGLKQLLRKENQIAGVSEGITTSRKYNANQAMKYFEQGTQFVPLSKQWLDDFAYKVSGRYSGSKVAIADPKSLESSMRKLRDELGFDANRLTDRVRNTIVGLDDGMVEAIANDIRKSGKVVAEKKFTYSEDPLGYDGYKFNVDTPNMIGELQVSKPEMIFAKFPTAEAKAILGKDLYNQVKAMADQKGLVGGQGHIMYEKWRLISGDLKKTDIPANKIEILKQEKANIEKMSKEYYKQFQTTNTRINMAPRQI